MGGSFNPPTVTHFKLMKAAIDAIDASIGFFFPASDAYLIKNNKTNGYVQQRIYTRKNNGTETERNLRIWQQPRRLTWGWRSPNRP